MNIDQVSGLRIGFTARPSAWLSHWESAPLCAAQSQIVVPRRMIAKGQLSTRATRVCLAAVKAAQPPFLCCIVYKVAAQRARILAVGRTPDKRGLHQISEYREDLKFKLRHAAALARYWHEGFKHLYCARLCASSFVVGFTSLLLSDRGAGATS